MLYQVEWGRNKVPTKRARLRRVSQRSLSAKGHRRLVSTEVKRGIKGLSESVQNQYKKENNIR